MKRLEKFKISPKTPYAVKAGSLSISPKRDPSYVLQMCRVEASWVKKKDWRICAFYGTLWNYFKDSELPKDEADFVARHVDGRYGWDSVLRWDGNSAFSHGGVSDRMNAEIKPFLEAVLKSVETDGKWRVKNVPVPEGYDGWFVFEH